MNRATVRIYARSIYNAARNEKVLDDAMRDLEKLNQGLNSRPDYIRNLQNPLIPIRNRAEVVRKLTENSHPLVQRFMDFLMRRYALGILTDILGTLKDFQVEEQGGLVASLTVPHQLSEKEIETIRGRVKTLIGRDPHFKVVIDPSILGGFVIRSESYLIDASMKGYLKKLTGGKLHGS
ncbi:MAG TPA: ATP synthase F1 subunit delta [Thermoanaerobaculia bacterium]|nr:ATP synthase F1 subunit delta [Thermoanaerobaculia bacterium]HUM28912.1 ATP synthase F1 subunit delta [Thermoanaerobaculia bacterium]HXK67155.1 ATP synthase F1 subunit delta [Thermoanaerobaculia bacterium]